MRRRDFLKTAGLGGAAVAAGAAAGAPYVMAQPKTGIKWRLQTYAGAALAEFVAKPQIDAFNKAANGEMTIELYTADQLVQTGELFRNVQNGVIDAVQADEDSISSPADVSVFGAYFPFATRYSLDVPALFEHWGLSEIWKEAYDEIGGVVFLNAGSWDPCNIATTTPINKVDDLKGKKLYAFPSGGRFMTRFGVVPLTVPYEDVQMALSTGDLDGVCWCAITEMYTVGWADALKYYLTNNVCGAWIGSYLVNADRWNQLPEHLKTLFRLTCDSSHYFRQHWYWWGEAHYRVNEKKLELTTIPDSEWKAVEDEAQRFWDETASVSPRCAKVVQILKDYSAQMAKAGRPYRY
ncbi:MAG: TRAP transporter substrate-binding protein [Deltaproteobacteria bacterium]|jgi:TRAP-type mannitol/chloroaromatic compound transport system substrate-binding protein|nr:TRAP transporter substrate-binding protein [Deltaproteobacteria bacterium]